MTPAAAAFRKGDGRPRVSGGGRRSLESAAYLLLTGGTGAAAGGPGLSATAATATAAGRGRRGAGGAIGRT